MNVDDIYVRICGSTDYFTTLCAHMYTVVHTALYKWPTKVHYMSYSSNYTHCSQLLLIHRMVAYSNPTPAENEMATRAMLIRDAFMLPVEPLKVTSWHTALLSPTGPVEELPT